MLIGNISTGFALYSIIDKLYTVFLEIKVALKVHYSLTEEISISYTEYLVDTCYI